MNSTIASTGFAMPVCLGFELAIHADHCPAGFGLGSWSDQSGPTSTFGFDAGRLRCRLVIDRVGERDSTGWGCC
ncbi:hypothetical protein KBY66_03145 [Synechococcus sp. Tobar12-5m-g]|uniref:hypothetical protein n=1 Tax=unclassified Synechococcus TaxID=2626047 RepID=UPI0020CE2ACB|nr:MULTISPECIES: hypothetical protein [unclassified Synechococcus]MCP9771628.1 hypothetical protein [Synechococcus sp. Tobar12-5m-g]MCP9872569.1 hypothetical protein [Synechococcus sp. Cruz CV-v-12]